MPKSVNTQGTDGGRVTVGLPDARYEVIDKYGEAWGPFISLQGAGRWAKIQWPDQEQDEDRTGKGWDIQVVGS